MTRDERWDQIWASGQRNMNAYVEETPGMYEVKKGSRVVNREIVTTWQREIISANLLTVEAGTNGYHGGDSGHGSRTYIRIKNDGGTDINARVLKNLSGDTEEIEIALGGDTELETFIEALKFITEVLEKEKEVRS